MSELKMKTNEELILLRQTFRDSAQAIGTLANLAKGQGLVEDLYIERIQQRELEYPTGLEMPVPLAIPHIAAGCNQPFVSIATLEKPVAFKSMDRSGDDVMVKIIFLFGILDPKSQLAVLRRFAAAFADKEAVERLLAAERPADLLRELNQILEGLLSIG